MNKKVENPYHPITPPPRKNQCNIVECIFLEPFPVKHLENVVDLVKPIDEIAAERFLSNRDPNHSCPVPPEKRPGLGPLASPLQRL